MRLQQIFQNRFRTTGIISISTMLTLVIICLQLSTKQAWGIDPGRTLSQALIRKWQFPQGLPQPRVQSVYQTKDKRLWLGTQAGLFQFDGVQFSSVKTRSKPFPGNLWVVQMLEDEKERLWIATTGEGLFCLDDHRPVHFGREEGLPSNNVRCLLNDSDGTLWVGTDQGLVHLRDGSIVPFDRPTEFEIRDVRALARANNGAIYIGCDQGRLILWQDGKFSEQTLSTLTTGAVIRALLALPNGDLLIGTTDGLIRLDSKGETRIGRENGLADDFVETLLRSEQGQIWVGTRDGLSRMTQGDIETLRARDGLSQSTVSAIFEDHENNIWVGTKNGLNQLVDRRTVPWTVNEGLPSNETGALLQDADNRIWIGTLDAGLARYDGRRCEPVSNRESGLPSNRVTALALGKRNELWVGTDQGLCRMVGISVEDNYQVAQGLPSDVIHCLHRDPEGTLWIGTSRGIANLTGNSVKSVLPESDISLWPTRVIIDAADSGLVVATEGGGIFHLNDHTARRWLPEIPELRYVTALLRGPGKSYWAATRGEGLFLIEEGSAARVTVQQGLYDDEIVGLVSDEQNRLWMACSRGIFYIPESELVELIQGKRESVTSTQFSPLEALRTIECQQGVNPSLWRMRDGKIWFSTIHGAMAIDSGMIFRELPPPPVRIEQLQINGEDVDPRVPITLAAGPTNIHFRYTAYSLTNPLRMTFRYRLEGFDSDWIDAGSRRDAYYTNLPPGRYRFHLEAANRGNDWSATTTIPELRVRPHFYKTFWFYGVVCFLLAMTAWGILRFREFQVRSRLNAALAERMRIARDLHDTLIQGFSGVTMQMQALSARLKNPDEQATLQEVIVDASRCLRDARQTVIGLRHDPESSTSLVDAVSRAAHQITEMHDIQLHLRMPAAVPLMPSEVEYNLLRIAQEAMMNAVKHSGAKNLAVEILSRSGNLTLSIADDGCGFSTQEQQVPVGHYGVIGMRERAHHIQGTLTIDSVPGRGTIVTVGLHHIPTSVTPLAGGTQMAHSAT